LRTFSYLGAIAAAAAQGGFYGPSASTSGLHHLALFLVAVSVAFLLINVFDRSLTRSTARPPTEVQRTAFVTPEGTD
jgi:hypothetical protein